MKFSAIFVGSLAGTLAAVAAFAIYDSFDPGFFFLRSPRLIVFPILIAGAQAFFLGLPVLFVLNHFNRLNWLTAVLSGSVIAALPWSLILLLVSTPSLPITSWLSLFGAIGGLVGYLTARAVSPNNSFKPSPLRGLGANRFRSGGPA